MPLFGLSTFDLGKFINEIIHLPSCWKMCFSGSLICLICRVYTIGLESYTDKETNSNKKHLQYLHLEADFICVYELMIIIKTKTAFRYPKDINALSCCFLCLFAL